MTTIFKFCCLFMAHPSLHLLRITSSMQSHSYCIMYAATHKLYHDSHCFPLVTTIEFDSPDYTVMEDNSTVTVCLTTNRGIAIALDVEVVASFKPSSSNPACKACMYICTCTYIIRTIPVYYTLLACGRWVLAWVLHLVRCIIKC